MTDREVLRAAARDVRTVMRRRQANETRVAGYWVPVDPDLDDLAVECDEVIYSQRPETADLGDRLAAVLGDDWEP